MKTIAALLIAALLCGSVFAEPQASSEQAVKKGLADFFAKQRHLSVNNAALFFTAAKVPTYSGKIKTVIITNCAEEWSAELLVVAKLGTNTSEGNTITAEIKRAVSALQAATVDKAKTDEAMRRLVALKALEGKS